jgi:hypothetical protein
VPHANHQIRARRSHRRLPRALALLIAALLMAALLLLAACAGGSSARTGPTATPGGASAPASTTTPPGQTAATADPTAFTTPGAAQGTAGLCAQPSSVSAQPPASIPAYPGATLRIGQSQNGAGLFGYCSSAGVSSVTIYYSEKLPAAGWQNVTDTAIDTTQQFTAYKGSSAQVIVTILPDSQIAGMTDIIIATSGL